MLFVFWWSVRSQKGTLFWLQMDEVRGLKILISFYHYYDNENGREIVYYYHFCLHLHCW